MKGNTTETKGDICIHSWRGHTEGVNCNESVIGSTNNKIAKEGEKILFGCGLLETVLRNVCKGRLLHQSVGEQTGLQLLKSLTLFKTIYYVPTTRKKIFF